MENKATMNKKGIMDMFELIKALFAIGITLVLVTILYINWVDKFDESTLATYTMANTSTHQIEEITQSWDWIPLAVLIGLFIFIIILAMYIPANPAFIILYIIFGLIGVIISALIANTWEEFSSDALISGTVTSYYPLTNIIMSNLPYIFAILMFVLLVVTYIKGGSYG